MDLQKLVDSLGERVEIIPKIIEFLGQCNALPPWYQKLLKIIHDNVKLSLYLRELGPQIMQNEKNYPGLGLVQFRMIGYALILFGKKNMINELFVKKNIQSMN